MNIGDSQNVVVRRRKLVEDVNVLQANVINTNKSLLKLQVNQDTDYWHLKEKYDQVKGARERLQQNMLQLQMQFEAVSGECQQERQLRADSVNKHDSTRKLCDELERLVEQIKEVYAKIKADQKALYDAYLKSDKVVEKLKQDLLSMKEKSKQRIRELEGEITQMMAQLSQMSTVYSQCQKRADAELNELRSQLREARVAERELAASTAKLGTMKAEMEQKEATILNLQRDMRNMVTNINNQLADAKNILMKKDNDIKKATEEIESLKKALSNQEQFTKMQCDHNSGLQEKLALLEEEHQKDIAAYKINLEEVNSMCQTLNSNIAKLQEQNDNLTKELNEKQETITLHEQELESFQQQLLQYDTNLGNVKLELNNTIEESQKKTKIIEKLETENEILVTKIFDVETALTNHRSAFEEQLKQQRSIIEAINKEYELQTSIINNEKEEHVKLEKELQAQALTLKETSHEIELKTEALNQANIELQSTKDERDTLVTELQNKTEIIDQLNRDLKLKCSTLLQNKEEHDKLGGELQKQAATIEEKNMELELKISTLAQEKKERAKLEAALQKLKKDWESESERTKEREKNLKEKVSQLETGIKVKDEELSREMTNFLQRRNQFEKEKCVLQANINGLEQRIKNIMMEASNMPRREPVPEPDDNAMAFTPRHKLPARSPILQRHSQTPGSFQDTLFNYFSEPSAESLDSQEPRYLSFASHGEALPSPPPHPPANKRVRPDTPPVRGKSNRANIATADTFMAAEKKSKPNRFFKSRGNSRKK